MTHTIRTTFTLPVSPVKAFALLTEARKIRAWSGQAGTVQPAIGGKFSMFGGWVKGNVLAYQPGKHLAYTWLPADWKKGTPPSIVVYRFTRAGSKTRVAILHKHLPTASAMRDHTQGWKEHVAGPLKQFIAEKGA